jgi:circadian clock protein KaiC
MQKSTGALQKLQTGIHGFDEMAYGGLPRGRSTLVSGTAGAGKTIFGLQFLFSGIKQFGEPGVLASFEERPDDLLRNVSSFSWNLDKATLKKSLAIVDATAGDQDEAIEAGQFDLSPLMLRIEAAVKAVGAKRLVLDSIGALFPQFSDAKLVRQELHRIATRLRKLGVTTLMTMERTTDEGDFSRFGVEEFVADNVIVLRNRLELERRRRTMEILKLRGAAHYKGEYPFTVDPADGFMIIPLSADLNSQPTSLERISTGVKELDTMCGGGFYKDSVILATGPTGTGKTLIASHFMRAGYESRKKVLLIATEESREQLIRNASAWGADYAGAEKKGLLRIVSRLPETMGLEDHLIHVRREIDEFRPARLVIDSITALERAATLKSFREFIIGIVSKVRHTGVSTLLTTATPMMSVGHTATEIHISTLTDTIILLRYVELDAEIRRGVAVIKMRGTKHEKAIREYTIDDRGMQIGAPFRGIHGILGSGHTYLFAE